MFSLWEVSKIGQNSVAAETLCIYKAALSNSGVSASRGGKMQMISGRLAR